MQDDIREIPGYLGYGATRSGEIWSRMIWGGKHSGELSADWLRRLGTRLIHTGYEQVWLRKDDHPALAQVHRLVWMTFGGPLAVGVQINHKNGVKTDNHLENLEACSASFNVRHAITNGLRSPARGVSHGMARLSEDSVREIKRRLLLGDLQKSIASDFGVVPGTIQQIANGRNWRHVEVNHV